MGLEWPTSWLLSGRNYLCNDALLISGRVTQTRPEFDRQPGSCRCDGDRSMTSCPAFFLQIRTAEMALYITGAPSVGTANEMMNDSLHICFCGPRRRSMIRRVKKISGLRQTSPPFPTIRISYDVYPVISCGLKKNRYVYGLLTEVMLAISYAEVLMCENCCSSLSTDS